MNPDRNISVCFTGHRLSKIDSADDAYRAVTEAVRAAVEELYGGGYRCFLSGMADGFDLWAARAVLDLRASGRCEQLSLVAVVPFAGHRERLESSQWELYDQIIKQADQTIVLADHYSPWCYAQRNDYLVDNSALVVAYYKGIKGGTQYTLRRARKARLRVINIFSPELF